MRLVYITTMFPMGSKEAFLAPEVRCLLRRGVELLVIPMRDEVTSTHAHSREFAALTRRTTAFGTQALRSLAHAVADNPLRVGASVARLVRHSGRALTIAKNAFVLAKSAWTARAAEEFEADHIHVHWGGATASMGYYASALSRIPWSFTAHRWDIAENNALGEKVRTAAFVRAISERGRKDLIRITAAAAASKVRVIHMGVEIPAAASKIGQARQDMRLLVPANLVEVKGHAYLFEAVRIVSARALVHLDVAGDGPLRGELELSAKRQSLPITFLGAVAHDHLLQSLQMGTWDAVVLPSVVSAVGDCEGIPVSLMEAMSCGVPVISTNTGGIPELLGDGSGIMVPERDARALAAAISQLNDSREVASRLAVMGRARIMRDFSIESSVDQLLRECQKATMHRDNVSLRARA